MEDTPTVAAVRQYLATRRIDETRSEDADAVAAAAALRLAHVLDSTTNATSAANASRELRQVIQQLQVAEPEPPSFVDELRERHLRRRHAARFAALQDELAQAMEPDAAETDVEPDDGADGAGPTPNVSAY